MVVNGWILNKCILKSFFVDFELPEIITIIVLIYVYDHIIAELLLLLLTKWRIESMFLKVMLKDVKSTGAKSMQIESANIANICTSLFWRLSGKGISPDGIQHLIYDVFNLLRNGGSFTVTSVNFELEQMGWGSSMIDEYCFELIIFILENEFDYNVKKRALH